MIMMIFFMVDHLCCRFMFMLVHHFIREPVFSACCQIVALNKTKERMRPYHVPHENEDPDIKKIKKVICTGCFGAAQMLLQQLKLSAASAPQVQSFMRGWLCRRKWKIIVQDYICSPHAESMRKRNQIVFNMVEAETEYAQGEWLVWSAVLCCATRQ